MDDQLIRDLAILLTGVAVAKFTDWLAANNRNSKLKKSLLSELKVLRVELDRSLLGIERQIQVFAAGGIEHRSTMPVHSFVYENYYKEVVQDLTMDQRISFQMIHSTIRTFNNSIKDVELLFKDTSKKAELSDADLEQFGEISASQYISARQAIWHIEYHLSKPESPSLNEGANIHKEYLKSLESAHIDIERIKESGRSIPREDFEKIYNPRNFEPTFDNLRTK